MVTPLRVLTGLVRARGRVHGMDDEKPKADLQRYLQAARDAMVWKLDGLSEYQVRRPMTPTGTNLLGLVKHLTFVEMGYFGPTFGRPVPEVEAWMADDVEPNVDMWATAEETREELVAQYRKAWAMTDATVADLSLDSPGEVPWWHPDHRAVSLHLVLVHVTAETHRHAGHADIVREMVDGAAGLRAGGSNMPDGVDSTWWEDYRARLQAAAKAAEG
jgi:hypothetical protein